MPIMNLSKQTDRHCQPNQALLHSHRLGEISREIDIESFANSQPVGDELERDDVQETLKTVDRLGDLNLLRFLGGEFAIIWVADDDRSSTTSND